MATPPMHPPSLSLRLPKYQPQNAVGTSRKVTPAPGAGISADGGVFSDTLLS